MVVVERKIKNKNKAGSFLRFGLFLFFISIFFTLSYFNLVRASSPPYIITYQGKLLNNGISVTTTQDIKFVLYDAVSAGNALYSAGGTTSSPSAVSTTLNNGFFTVNLGDSGTNSLDPSIFKNNQTVYLEVIIGSETLSPRKRLTASPFALNSQYLNGVSASSSALSSTYIPISDASGNFNFNNITSTAINVGSLIGTSASFTNATSSGSFWSNLITAVTGVFTNLTTTGDSSLATTTITSSTVGYLNVSNNENINGLLTVTGNSSFGTIASGTWNGNAISNVYGGTGQDSSGWSGFLKVTNGVWSTSTVDLTTFVSGTLPLANGGTGTTTMATGGVVFSDGSKLTQDTSKFYWDNTNKFLGIGTSSPQQRLHLYDGTLLVDSPASPTTTGYVASSSLSTVSSIDISGKYVYTTSFLGNRLVVVDVSNPASPSVVSSVQDNSQLLGAWSVKVLGKYAYVIGYTGDSLAVVDISNPYSMSVVGFVSSSVYFNNPSGLYVVGNTAYVTSKTGNQLTAIDISNPSYPTVISTKVDNTYLNGPSGVYVQGGYAYVANSSGSGVAVVDVSNPHSLSISGFTSSSVMSGANKIYVSGNYAYVAATTSNALAIIDISNPSSPTTTGSVSSAFALSEAIDVKVAGKYAYVVGNQSNALAVINISDKTNPSLLGLTYSPVYLVNPMAVVLSGKYAYVASYGGGTITVVDIKGADISSASIGDVFTNSLNVWENSDFGNNLSVRNGLNVGIGGILSNGAISLNVGNTVSTSSLFSIATSSRILTVFGDGSIGVGVTSTLAKLDVLDSSGHQLLLRYNDSVAASFGIDGGGNLFISPYDNGSLTTTTLEGGFVVNTSSLVVDRSTDYVGIGTLNPQQKLHLFNGALLIDNTASPTLAGTVTMPSSPAARSVYVTGKVAYVLTSNGLTAVNIENKSNPIIISSLSIGGVSTAVDRSLAVLGRYAYVSSYASNTLDIVDVSNPSSMSIVGSVADSNNLKNPLSVVVSGNYAYVAAYGTSTVSVVDVSIPSEPMVVGHVTDATKFSSVDGLYINGRYLYAVSRDNNYLVVIDVSDPPNPTIVGFVSDGTNMNGPYSVYVSGNYAYVASFFSKSLAIVDVSNPTSPFVTAGLIDATNLDDVHSVYVSGKYAYLTSAGGSRLSIVDISDTSTLNVVGSYTSSSINFPSAVYISGKYAYIASVSSANLVIIDLKGADINAATIGNISSNDLTVWENSDIGNNLYVRNGINVGIGGILSSGSLSINSNISSGDLFAISSSTNSRIFSISASGDVAINTSTFGGGTSYKLKIDAGDPANGAIGVNGFIRATAYITPSTTLDLAETYPVNMSCVGSGVCPENGDVVCVDPTVVSGVKKCSLEDKNNMVGIVSTNPGFLLGGGDFSNPSQTLGSVKVALAGRVPVKVSSENGNISAGDKLTISNTSGVAAKALGDSPIVAVAMESFSGSSPGNIVAFVNIGWQNSLYQALSIDTSSSTLTVGSDLTPYNLNLSGELTMFNTVLNKLVFNATALFESNTNDTHAFIFNAKNFGTSTDKYLLSLRSNDEPRFSVLANGDVHTSGNIYAASAVFGTSTNPGDLAERVDVAADDIVEPGDVMVVDMNNPDTYRRSNGSSEQAVAGVISTNPSIVVGNGKTEYTAVMAMVGRVPVKVSSENGNINRGDLLVTASSSGYAMKYDPKKDRNEKMVGVIGVALEPFSEDKGKILTLIRTGWVNSRFDTINKLKSDISQLAVVQGINLNTTSTKNLNVNTNSGGQLGYVGGDLNLEGNVLLNVASISSKNNRWSIDESGHFITKLSTSQGEKEMFAMQSPISEFVFSSSSQLIAGEANILFDQTIQDIIDFSQPLKINVTLTSGEAKGIYVSEKNNQGFTVKELSGGQSSATFDWIVVAKRKDENLDINSTQINSQNFDFSNPAPVITQSDDFQDQTSTTIDGVSTTTTATLTTGDNNSSNPIPPTLNSPQESTQNIDQDQSAPVSSAPVNTNNDSQPVVQNVSNNENGSDTNQATVSSQPSPVIASDPPVQASSPADATPAAVVSEPPPSPVVTESAPAVSSDTASAQSE